MMLHDYPQNHSRNWFTSSVLVEEGLYHNLASDAFDNTQLTFFLPFCFFRKVKLDFRF